MELTPEIIENAINGALVSRGKRKGMLKSKCPKMNTPEAAAWNAIMSHANPFKVGFGHVMFMNADNRAIFNAIDETIKVKGIDVRTIDRDRFALEMMGAW
jgi:hypothetical protein